MAAQSPTESAPTLKRSSKSQNEPAKLESEKKTDQFISKIPETAKPIFEEQALLKEKLKTQPTWKKDKDSGSLRRKNQPMVARPISPGAAPKQTFTQQFPPAISTKPPSPPPTRRRTHSPSSSFNAGTQRSSSPLSEISPEFKRNIEKATRARLYLLQQVGPNSFLIGGDSPSHKFKVIIGPQTCTCAKAFCVHLLFVMLRVFQVKENDPVLWNTNLRNYEVEGLFSKFHARVNSRLAKNTSRGIRGRGKSPNRRTPPPSPSGISSSSSEPSTSSNKDEEEVCPICLLEMVEGESLTCCKNGCNNRLHQHCMEIWAVECKQRKERLNCPLCRRILTSDAAPFLGDRSPKCSPLSPNRTVTPIVPTPLGPEVVITLPHSDPIPAEQIELARPWIQVFGEDIASCMFSREWCIRETALRRLSKDLDTILSNNDDRTTSMTSLESCCSLLSMMCGDPVYKVYVAALRTLRVMLGLTHYTSDDDRVAIQALLRPVIETIMSKCYDGNRRISALSIKVLLEICKDQNGELALGRMLAQNNHQTIGGLGFMLTCILTTAHEYATWPWWLGRLCFLQRLLEDYVDLFQLEPDCPEVSFDNSVGVIIQEGDHIDGNTIYSDNMTRLMSVLRFAILAGQCSHTMVSKLAITILLCCTSLAANCPSAFVHIKKLVSKLRPSQRSVLQRRLATLSRTTSVENSDGDSSPLSDVSAAILDNQTDESGPSSETSSGYSSSRRTDTTRANYETDDLSDTDLLQSIVESLKRPNFLCLNLPNRSCSPSRDIDSLEWSRSEGESPRLPPVKLLSGNKCRKKIEDEENEAIAKAMEVSTQERGPKPIHSLRPSVEEDDMVIVYTQPESIEKAVKTKHLYMENIHWKKGELLGTGAFSSCYAARDVFTGALMAVKQVSFCRNSKSEQEKVCQAILDEISILGKLQHPNLIKCLGATKHTGHFNLFFEWMAGGSISSLLSKYGAFEESTLIRYTRQILQGVAYLHLNQVIHRDIKGANVLVDSTGQNLRIADFGAAARLATHITGAGEFQGQLLGTIAFMAPEVLRGESYGRSCDVWSVGCLLIEMATGRPPWNAHEHSNHLALIFKIACATSPPEIPESLNPAIRDVLLRCFEQKPEDRPQAMELLKHPLFTQVSSS